MSIASIRTHRLELEHIFALRANLSKRKCAICPECSDVNFCVNKRLASLPQTEVVICLISYAKFCGEQIFDGFRVYVGK